MKKVHLVMQGKGGVGKSLVASIIAQHLTSQGREIVCVDTDPINRTFSGYRALKAIPLEIMDEDEIRTRAFDSLIDIIMESPGDIVVDCGASSFLPLAHYLITNEVVEFLEERQVGIAVHTLITGGQALVDTLSGFTQLAKQFPSPSQLCVWLNPFWGKIEASGKRFEETKAYLEYKDQVSAIIELPAVKAETFGQDIKALLEQRLTFSEVAESPDFQLMQKQRLVIFHRALTENINAAMVLG